MVRKAFSHSFPKNSTRFRDGQDVTKQLVRVGLIFLVLCLPETEALFFNIIKKCTSNALCRRCEGDCRRDDSVCYPGLKCMRRGKNEKVPGCEGNGKRGIDYCYLPDKSKGDDENEDGELSNERHCDQFSPCGRCEGVCDRHSDCLPGFECFLTTRKQDIPGCSGVGKDGAGYCYDPNDDGDGGKSKVDKECSMDSPCQKCTGYCEDDSDCTIGLSCFERKKDEDVPGCEKIDAGSGDSVCYDSKDGDKCSETAPCMKCMGQCEDDSDCTVGLSCFERKKDEDVPGCEKIDAGSGDSVCYDPDDADKCSVDSPCQKCKGHCKDNDDCALGLACFEWKWYEDVPGCGKIEAGSGVSVCYDPDDTEKEAVLSTPTPSSANGSDPNLSEQIPKPSFWPSIGPTHDSTPGPTRSPSPAPTVRPTSHPTIGPTVSSTTSETDGQTDGPTPVPMFSTSVIPSYSPSTEPGSMASPTPSASSDDRTEFIVILLSRIFLRLTFHTTNRKMMWIGRRFLLVIDESQLSFVIMNSLIESFGSTFSSFEAVVLELFFNEELLTEDTATISYSLNCSVHFTEGIGSPLPSQNTLDNVAVDALNDEGFVASLRQSDDPALASVQRAEIFLSADLAQDEDDSAAMKPWDSSDKNKNRFIAILVPILVASLLLLMVIAAVYLRHHDQELPAQVGPQEKDEISEWNQVSRWNRSMTSNSSSLSKRFHSKLASPTNLTSIGRKLESPANVATDLFGVESNDPPDLDGSICGKSASDWSMRDIGRNHAPHVPADSDIQCHEVDDTQSISTLGTDNMSANDLAHAQSVDNSGMGHMSAVGLARKEDRCAVETEEAYCCGKDGSIHRNNTKHSVDSTESLLAGES